MALVTVSCFVKKLKAIPHIVSSNGSSFWKKNFKTASSLKNGPSKTMGYFNISEKGMEKLKIRDSIPDNYTLIYKAPMETGLKIVYPVITLTSIATSAYVLYYYEDSKSVLTNRANHEIKFLNPNFEIRLFLGGIIVIALAGLAVIFKFPFRVYKHNSKKEYIALFLSFIPWKLCQFHFQNASLTRFKNPLYFFMENCHYSIDNKKAFLLSHYFRKPVDLCEMEGSK